MFVEINSILNEIRNTLLNNNKSKKKRKRKYFTDEHRQKFDSLLSKATVEIIESKPIEDMNIYIRDRNDIHIIETAINGKADVLITGDKDFEEVKTSLFKIVKPSEF